MKNIIMLMALLNIAAFAQGTFTDSRDGKKYKTVKIGSQTWMAENLNFEIKGRKGSKCFIDCAEYGSFSLYDWKTALNVCPSGWHLPSDKEWQTLVNFAGGENVAGKKLKANSGWSDAKGSDNYGFSAMPCNMDEEGEFLCSWWTASEENSKSSYRWDIWDDDRKMMRFGVIKNASNAVRCIQDSSEETVEAEGGSGGIGNMLGGLMGGSADGGTKSRGGMKAPSARDIDMGSGDGSRSKEEIMAVVNSRMPGLRNIYNKYLKLKPGFSGKVIVKLTIVPEGGITDISIVSSTTGYPDFDNAVKNMVATWKWKVIKSGNTTPTIPFTFTE